MRKLTIMKKGFILDNLNSYLQPSSNYQRVKILNARLINKNSNANIDLRVEKVHNRKHLWIVRSHNMRQLTHEKYLEFIYSKDISEKYDMVCGIDKERNGGQVMITFNTYLSQGDPIVSVFEEIVFFYLRIL